MNAKPSVRETQVRFVRFLVVGGGSALIQFAVLWWLKQRMGDTMAFTISWTISTATHYLLNRFWALPSTRQDSVRQLGEYLFAVGVSYGINLTAYKICRSTLGFNVMWSAFWAIPPSTLVVFLLLNYRVFRKPPE
ncbi:MAG: GtrA family protein [Opitutaceae bacterium]